ncbi:hypothetical protein CDAR_222411 [Caerostris darwini]|uniref:Uncharacterized protein n=1 Tax=Caerostris darwini TaxID=1538125 RepID=A0AAV4T0Y7_9ARAC|nr:hypothetical protein CDAR_222411 [Caerostris darwini]
MVPLAREVCAIVLLQGSICLSLAKGSSWRVLRDPLLCTPDVLSLPGNGGWTAGWVSTGQTPELLRRQKARDNVLGGHSHGNLLSGGTHMDPLARELCAIVLLQGSICLSLAKGSSWRVLRDPLLCTPDELSLPGNGGL